MAIGPDEQTPEEMPMSNGDDEDYGQRPKAVNVFQEHESPEQHRRVLIYPVTGLSIPVKVEYKPPVRSSIYYQYYLAHSISAGFGASESRQRGNSHTPGPSRPPYFPMD